MCVLVPNTTERGGGGGCSAGGQAGRRYPSHRGAGELRACGARESAGASSEGSVMKNSVCGTLLNRCHTVASTYKALNLRCICRFLLPLTHLTYRFPFFLAPTFFTSRQFFHLPPSFYLSLDLFNLSGHLSTINPL